MPDAAALRLALTTLTVLPVRGPAVLDRRVAGGAMVLAPAVGLLLGLTAAGVLAGLRSAGAGDLLAAVAAVAVLAAATRGLHLDGLADTADGLASYLPAERAREVMKAPDVGALGMVAVVLDLALQAAALSVAPAVALVLAGLVSRTAVAGACTSRTPPASAGGLGALVAGTVRPAAAYGWCAAAVVAGGLLDGLRGAAAAAVALLLAEALRAHAVRRLGGVTGDVLGALVETATTAVLVVSALGAA